MLTETNVDFLINYRKLVVDINDISGSSIIEHLLNLYSRLLAIPNILKTE